MGRCARHIEGRAILYADRMTDSMRFAIGETYRRRAKQQAYNIEHNITPHSIIKAVDMELAAIVEADYLTVPADDLMTDIMAPKTISAAPSSSSKRKCAKPPRNSNSSAPPPFAIASAPSGNATSARFFLLQF